MHSYSTPEWIIEAKNTHGDWYDYSKTVYVRAHSKVTITCNEHGDFEQNPSHHLHGQGCAKCAVGARGYSTPEWIIEAKNTHDGRYDYSKVVYVCSKDKVIITCRLHGDFEQTPSEHLKGHGCAKCSGKHNYSTHEWIIEAGKVHNKMYDYSKSVYARTLDKVVITCKEHGDFEQVASSHLRGRGCPRCFYDRDQPTEVYLMQMGEQVKIGISIDPKTRLAKLNRNNPKQARIVAEWTLRDFPTAFNIEQQIHRELAGFNAGLSGFDGATEWFDATPEYATTVIERILTTTTTNRDALPC